MGLPEKLERRSHLRQADRLCCRRTDGARAHGRWAVCTARLPELWKRMLEHDRATCSLPNIPGKRVFLRSAKVFNVRPTPVWQLYLELHQRVS